MPDPGTCSTCAWWVPRACPQLPAGHPPVGACHGAPPIGLGAPLGTMPHDVANHERLAVWPLTTAVESCRAWSRKVKA